MVDGVLAQAGLSLNDVDAIAFGRGPGAFTGIRIAAGVTQGLALGAGLPVIPVSSLATLAQGVINKSATLLPAIDARMGEIYWAAYDVSARRPGKTGIRKNRWRLPTQFKFPAINRIFGVGSGWATYRATLEGILGKQITGVAPERFPLAKDMLPLAMREFNDKRYVTAEQALPVYLRDNVVKQWLNTVGTVKGP